jgi:Zinc carboxypeptidase
MNKKGFVAIIVFLLTVIFPILSAQDIDKEATEKIREYTTDPQYITPLVDHLPSSEKVPAPHQVLGYVTGAPGHMTYYKDILHYFQVLAAASERVKIFEVGKSHEGKQMIAVAVGGTESITNIEEYRKKTSLLADPRLCDEEAMKGIVAEAKPFYMFTGGLHSPETGSPEMLMEMAYRLAVSEDPLVRRIRDNVITLIIPVLEIDGWNRQVDWYYHHTKKFKQDEWEDIPRSSPPIWGNYTVHDNNRDGIMLSQPLSKNMNESFFMFHPQVVHDLHESIPLLYISTGTGPYYPSLSPIVRNEWQWLAFNEVTRMTSMGVPGVWTWGFFTGWFPGYGAWPGNNHNAISRFYETFGNAGANTYERIISQTPGEGRTSEEWYRPLPPPAKTLWSLRNNINIMESSCLVALEFTALHKDTILENFWKKGRNSISKGESEKPYAWIIPREQKDPVASQRLLHTLQLHRIEVRQLTEDFPLEDRKFPAGSLVIRMDQPYRNFAKTLLEKQDWPEKSTTRPYDATTWTIGLMMGVETVRIDSETVLNAPMQKLEPTPFSGALRDEKTEAKTILIPPQGNATLSAVLALEGEDIYVTDQAIETEDQVFPAGTLICNADSKNRIEKVCSEVGIKAITIKEEITAKRKLTLPRLGLYSGWFTTQDPGWARYALDAANLPFDWLTKERVSEGSLNSRYDVIIIPHHGGRTTGLSFMRGIDSRHSPLDYKQSEEFQYLGSPMASEDITGGLGLEGISALEQFVHKGGTLITLGSGSRLVTDFGLLSGVSAKSPPGLVCPGTLVSGWVKQENNPVVYGVTEHPVLYQSSMPVFEVAKFMRSQVVMQFGTKLPKDVMNDMSEEERQAHKDMQKEHPLRISGLLKGEKGLDGTAAVVDAPLGRGRVVLFAFNPLYRWMNQANFPMVFNALLNWDAPEELRKTKISEE